jgi:dynein heavy chain 1, cytosolic
LVLEGAAWIENQLTLNNGESVRLNPSQIRWVQIDESETAEAKNKLVNLPVYLNGDRSDVLFTIDLPFEGASSAQVATRAVCLTASG